MTSDEFTRAVHHIGITTPGIWPHGLQPMLAVQQIPGQAAMSFGFDQQHPATEQEWLDYGYNPPGRSLAVHPLADDDVQVRSKPTYAELVTAAVADHLAGLPADLVTQVNLQCVRRVAETYHSEAGNDRNKEWQVRLSGVSTVTQDAERVRLIAVCHAFEVKIAAATTLLQLEAIDPASEALWSGAG